MNKSIYGLTFENGSGWVTYLFHNEENANKYAEKNEQFNPIKNVYDEEIAYSLVNGYDIFDQYKWGD